MALRSGEESFEATGTDLTWSAGKTAGSGCTVDEDNSGPGGDMPVAGSKCLYVDSNSSGYRGYYNHNYGSEQDPIYCRFYMRIVSEGLSDGNTVWLYRWADAGWGFDAGSPFRLAQSSGSLYFQSYHNGSYRQYGTTISLGQAYRIELAYDETADLTAFKVDGNTVYSSTINSKTGGLQHIILGHNSQDYEVEFYIDSYAEDTDWLGAVSPPVGGIGPERGIGRGVMRGFGRGI